MKPNQLFSSVFATLFVFGCGITDASAQLASRKASEWVGVLESPSRVAGQKVGEVLARLSLTPGMAVADIGAGSGLFTRAIAKIVAPTGTVFAVDIQQDLLDYINRRDEQEQIQNVKTVLGEFDDPSLPSRDIDLALINDVLHHIENRAAYLKTLGTYMKQSGRIAIIEMNKDDPDTPHRDQPELLLSRQDIDQWMSAAGFEPVQEFPDLFPGTRWFLVYGRK